MEFEEGCQSPKTSSNHCWSDSVSSIEEADSICTSEKKGTRYDEI